MLCDSSEFPFSRTLLNFDEIYFLLVSGNDNRAGPFELHLNESSNGGACKNPIPALQEDEAWPVQIKDTTDGLALVEDLGRVLTGEALAGHDGGEVGIGGDSLLGAHRSPLV